MATWEVLDNINLVEEEPCPDSLTPQKKRKKRLATKRKNLAELIFSFVLGVEKKGSGYPSMEILCSKIDRYC